MEATNVEPFPPHKLRTMVGDKLNVQARLHGTERQQGESCLALRHRIIAMWQKQRATELVNQAEPWYLRAMIAPTQKQIDNWFTYHAPKPGQPDRYEAIRAAGKAFASLLTWNHSPPLETVTGAAEELERTIKACVPHGREREIALSTLGYAVTDLVDGSHPQLVVSYIRQAVMWACAGIACGGE